MSPFGTRKGRIVWFRNERSSHPPESHHWCHLGTIWDSVWAQGGWAMVNTKIHQKRAQPQSPKPQWGPLTSQTASPLLELKFCVRNGALMCSLKDSHGMISGLQCCVLGWRFQCCVLGWRFDPFVTT